MESCGSCACTKTAERLAKKQGRVLRVVLWLNLLMFFVEAGAAMAARSSALLGDSLDMLGDALAYGATLFVLHRSITWKARATVLKGSLMAVTAVGVLVSAVGRAVAAQPPEPVTMTAIGMMALAVNGVCLLLLTRHRTDDMNMSSAWVCSRNDIIANVSVLGAAALVALTDSLWPDFIVGVGIAILFSSSALDALRTGLRPRMSPTADVAT